MKRILLLSFCLLTNVSVAQSLQQRLQTAFNKLQQDGQNQYASVSLTVLDAKTGQQLFAANPNMGLAPASTLKTITTITAMHILGADYRFKTTLSATTGVDINGTLNGDLVINGTGDPTLGSPRWEETKENTVLKQFADAIKRAGIKKINGSIIATGVNHPLEGWIWQDVGNYYGAMPNNLCWRENQYDILLNPTHVGGGVKVVGTVPLMPYLQFIDELKTGDAGTGDHAYAYLPINSNKVILKGSYAIDQQKKRISAALPDPGYEAARRLKDTLESLNITVTGKASSETIQITATENPDISVADPPLVIHYSPPLRKIIYWLNQKSINLYAEQLLLAMADSLKNEDHPSVLRNYWKERGIDINSLNIYDGSGLSPGDRVTTSTMAHILQTAKKETWFADFYDSLPVYNDMKMKSGSINNVLCYAGYQTTKSGQEVCFSIMVNNYNGSSSGVKQKMFEVLDELK